MTHSATYDRKAIMTAAWEIVRKANVALYGFRVIMRRALKAAWANAKHERAMEARQAKRLMPMRVKNAGHRQIMPELACCERL